MQKRITAIDVAKGITILSVVFNHCLGAFTSSAEILAPQSMRYTFDVIHQFNMPLFFFVAGMFAPRAALKPLKTSLPSKFIRLAVPYFTWGFLFALFKQIGGTLANHPAGLEDFLRSPVAPWSIFWFLYVLFFVYVIFLLTLRLAGARKGQLILTVVAGAAFLLFPYVPRVYIFPELCKFTIFFCLGSYALEFVRAWNARMNFARFLLSAAAFALVFGVFLRFDTGEHEIFLHYYQSVAAPTGICFVFSLAWAVENLAGGLFEVLDFCGRKSMEIYVSHSFVIGVLRVVLQKIFGAEYLWGRVALMFAVTGAVMYFVWKNVPASNKFYRFMFGLPKMK